MVNKPGKIWKAISPRSLEDRDDDFIDVHHIDQRVIDRVCEGLRAEQIGILPTETVYGLVGTSHSDAVVERIYEAKGRDRKKPLPVQVGRFVDVAGLGVQVNKPAEILAQNFWPGPMTLVLPFLGEMRCNAGIASALLKQWTEQKTVAVRIPDHPVAKLVLMQFGAPMLATSANASGEEPVTKLSQLDLGLRKKVDWIVDGGPTVFGRESTVVLCEGQEWRILREGALRGTIIQKAFAQPARRG